MANIKVGDKVRVKSLKTSPGFQMNKAVGTVVKWVEYDASMAAFADFVYVNIEKAEGDGKTYIGNSIFFRKEDLQKI